MTLVRFRSLRARLVLLTLVVEVIMISAIVWNSQRLAESHLMAQFEYRRMETSRLLQAALTPAMAQNDYAAINEILNDAQHLQGIDYMVMFDEEDRRIASASATSLSGQSLVSFLQNLPKNTNRLDFHVMMEIEQRKYGELLIGLDLKFLYLAQREMLVQNILIALLGILLTNAVLAGIAVWLTRHLSALTEASQALADGRDFKPLPNTGTDDDISQVSTAFNSMAHALKVRMEELSAAELTQRELADRLIFMVERDPLTGLANRSRFGAELQRCLDHMLRGNGQPGALLYFDIDEFKTINDTFGHRAGDTVLLRAAETIGKTMRTNEMLARLGGDEFVILAPEVDAAGAEILAERIIEAVRSIRFDFAGHQLGMTISLGIALFPEHGSDEETIVARADAAMYQAKASGKNCWRIYRPDLNNPAQMLHQLSWNDRIQRAIDDQLLVLHFQGIHAVQTGKVTHYEALVRMIEPDSRESLVMPGSFIPAAERSGRIIDIDRWVIRKAIETLAGDPALPALAINVSARSFCEPGLAQLIRSTLASFAVEPRRLIIELTETGALANIQNAAHFIEDVHALGCKVCLDDFGVGFSSFAYLKQLPADVLKIDGMFIRNLVDDPNDQVFVRAIVEVARGLGKKTVAEFVGSHETLRMLTEIGVDFAQGFHLSRPAPRIAVV